jgi:hypothetical protein
MHVGAVFVAGEGGQKAVFRPSENPITRFPTVGKASESFVIFQKRTFFEHFSCGTEKGHGIFKAF